MVICVPYCLCMCTFGARSLRRSVCVVAAMTAWWCLRACFWRLKATMRAVSRSGVLQNLSSIHYWAGVWVSCAIW